MIIISHRGYWKKPQEKNLPIAFDRSFSLGFGAEIDVRDYKGELVVSHDIAKKNCVPVSEIFDIYKKYNNNSPLALNIKSDGLQAELKRLLVQYDIKNYFVFDMSVPDGLLYVKEGFNAFTRESEHEKIPAFYNPAKGVWLDEFRGHWVKQHVLKKHIDANKKLCIVSPELHGRDYRAEWNDYKKMGNDGIMLCTDFPEIAKEFFSE